MPSADFCPSVAPPRDGASPLGPTGRSPRVLHCYFPPTYPSHIHLHLPCDIGLCIYVPTRPDADASDALHVLRAGSLLAPSSRHCLAANALGVQLVVPVTKAHRGLTPPSRSALPGAHNKNRPGAIPRRLLVERTYLPFTRYEVLRLLIMPAMPSKPLPNAIRLDGSGTPSPISWGPGT
jgi:hypothetical protein